jgi:hypothetical protein
MLLGLATPVIIGDETRARLESLFFSASDRLVPGGKLLDLSIDLSDSYGQDCPPISCYRLVTREPAFVRRVLLAPGELCAPGDLIAVLSTTLEEPDDGAAVRALRVTAAGILGHEAMWSMRPR